MSDGILIYAHNNEQHDYLKQAVYAADRVKLFTGIDVTIVTDKETLGNKKIPYNVILTDSESQSRRNMASKGEERRDADWYNANRNTAYDLTPYDRTIVMDSDYIVSSPSLKFVFLPTQQLEFLCYQYVKDISNRNTFNTVNDTATFGQFKMPMYWATIMSFRKGPMSKEIFDNMSLVKKHWKLFGDLYKFDTSLYRNDYALSIALFMVNGHRNDAINFFSDRLQTAPNDASLSIDKNLMYFKYDKQINNKTVKQTLTISGMDIHCLNKFSLENAIDNNI